MRAALFIGCVSVAACFAPNFDDVQCGPLGECPPGLLCDTATGICEESVDIGDPPGIDAAVADASAADAPPRDANAECDPLDQSTCADGQMCAFVATAIEGGDFMGYTACVPAAGGDPGSFCEWVGFAPGGMVSTCGPGLMCPGAVGDVFCTEICSTASTLTCEGAGSECREHAGGIFSDRMGVGLCTGL